MYVAVVLRGDRGLEQYSKTLYILLAKRCGRPSGRSRIGTADNQTAQEAKKSCGRPSGRSRIGTRDCVGGVRMLVVAVVLRGDRGLELSKPALLSVCDRGCGRPSGRSRIGTCLVKNGIVGVKLRSSFGAIEDWNRLGQHLSRALSGLRSSFGAIEDWNCYLLHSVLR